MKVLAAIDFSPASQEALNQARLAAIGDDNSMALCHVLPVMHEMTTFFPERYQAAMLSFGPIEADLRQAVGAKLESLLGSEQADLFIEQGVPYAELVRRAELWGADLLVVGSHGRTGLEHVLLGSVAERTVRHAHCSVLVSRTVSPSGVVLAATDLSDPSLPAIQAAADIAAKRGARLVVVSVVDWSSAEWLAAAGAMFGFAPALPSSKLQLESHAFLLDTLGQALNRLDATGESRVLDGPPAAAIVACAKELQAELIVVGTHGRTGLARLTLGSVAEQVVETAACSVLAVRLHEPPPG